MKLFAGSFKTISAGANPHIPTATPPSLITITTITTTNNLVALAALRLQILVQQQIKAGIQRIIQIGHLVRILIRLQLLHEPLLVGLARLNEPAPVHRLILQVHQIIDRIRVGQDVEEVIVAQRVHDGLDQLLGDLEPQARHRAARVHQNDDVLGRGGGYDVPGLEAAVEEVLAMRHRPQSARVASEQAVAAAEVLPEELVVLAEYIYIYTSDGSRSLDRIITTLYIFKYIIELS